VCVVYKLYDQSKQMFCCICGPHNIGGPLSQRSRVHVSSDPVLFGRSIWTIIIQDQKTRSVQCVVIANGCNRRGCAFCLRSYGPGRRVNSIMTHASNNIHLGGVLEWRQSITEGDQASRGIRLFCVWTCLFRWQSVSSSRHDCL